MFSVKPVTEEHSILLLQQRYVSCTVTVRLYTFNVAALVFTYAAFRSSIQVTARMPLQRIFENPPRSDHFPLVQLEPGCPRNRPQRPARRDDAKERARIDQDFGRNGHSEVIREFEFANCLKALLMR